jgi:hypothetical protein
MTTQARLARAQADQVLLAGPGVWTPREYRGEDGGGVCAHPTPASIININIDTPAIATRVLDSAIRLMVRSGMTSSVT